MQLKNLEVVDNILELKELINEAKNTLELNLLVVVALRGQVLVVPHHVPDLGHLQAHFSIFMAVVFHTLLQKSGERLAGINTIWGKKLSATRL